MDARVLHGTFLSDFAYLYNLTLSRHRYAGATNRLINSLPTVVPIKSDSDALFLFTIVK